jgi:hypothetical protein
VRGELAPYAEAVRAVAAEQHVPLIDLYARSLALVEKLGSAGVEPFEPKIARKPAAPNEPAAATAPDPDATAPADAPRRDSTHLTARGNLTFGAIVAEELRRVLPATEPCFRKAGAP